MKKQANIFNILIIFSFCLIILMPINSTAQDNYKKHVNAKWTTKTLPDVKMTGVHEDLLIVDNSKFLITESTIFIKKNKTKEIKISDDDLTFPSRARITYRVYSVPDEGNPYRKDQKVLTTVFIY